MWPGFDSRTRRHKWVEFVLILFSASRDFLRVIHVWFWFWFRDNLVAKVIEAVLANHNSIIHITGPHQFHLLPILYQVHCSIQYGDIDGDNDDESQNYIELVHLIENCSYYLNAGYLRLVMIVANVHCSMCNPLTLRNLAKKQQFEATNSVF